MGFKFQIVLADSLYGESGDFIEALNHHQLNLVVAIIAFLDPMRYTHEG